MLLTTALCSLLAQGPGGATANVDDPMSHGSVGDMHLSLDEAIRLANGTLAQGSLSPAELARISGSGAVGAIVVDAAVTPTITLETEPSDLIGQPMMVGRLMVSGLAHNGAKPRILGSGAQRAFTLRRHLVTVRGFRIEGAAVAVDAQMPAMAMPMSEMAMVMGCELHGQTTAAVRVFGSGTDETMLILRDCSITNTPLGFDMDDQTSMGMVMSENERVTFDGVTLGARVFEGGSGGMMSMWALFRSTFDNGETLVELRRAPTSTKQCMLRIVHSDAVCSDDVADVEGSAAGLTMFHHHHGDFVAGPGKKAFWVYPRTAQFDVHGSEMVFDGDVSVAANLTSPRIWQQNNTYRNGTVTYDVDGALPNLLWNRYENCTIDVPALARSPVAVRQSELVNTDVQGASFLAPITLTGCMRQGGAVSGFATEAQPAGGWFLGTTEVTPADPQVGTSLTLSADLPFGIGLVWDIAESYARPTTTAEPVRFYGDPATVVILPALVVFQSQLVVPLPNTPTLVGFEFYAQGIALPLLGQPWAPAYHLPRGSLVRFRP